MPLESASFLHQLEPSNPSGTDRVFHGDDHIRLLKAVLQSTFPNLTGALTLTQDQLNGLPALTVPTGAITLWYGTAETVPAGWTLCDGSTVALSAGGGNITSPDLRGRVPIGASGTDYVKGTPYGSTTQTVTSASSGSHAHTGSAASAGEHTHGGTTGGTSLSVSQIPTHSHLTARSGVNNSTLTAGAPLAQERSAGGDTQYILMGGSGEPDIGKTSDAGSGSAHDHSISPSGGHTHTVTIAENGGHTHSVGPISVLQPSLALHYIMKT